MQKSDEDAVRWAISRYWKEKSDAALAEGLKTDTESVRIMREQMGIKREETLKDFARRYLLEMGEKEKREFMERLPPELVWKMAEGNPHSTEDSTVTHVVPQPIMHLEAYEQARLQ